jgi:hypothetical protein
MLRILGFLSLFSLTFTSCKKDYTCACQQTVTTTAYTQYGTYYPQKTDINTFKNFTKTKKDKADSWCKNFENVRANTYGTGESQRTVTEVTTCEVD